MGTYTEVRLKVKLRADTPKDLIEWFYKVIYDNDYSEAYNSDHEFYKCQRYLPFICMPLNECMSSSIEKHNKNYVLCINSYSKHYDGELDKFISFITPYVASRKRKQYLGWYKNDSSDGRDYVHVNKSN